MKLEQQDDLFLLTIYCHATIFYFYFLNKFFFQIFLYSTPEEETIRVVFINLYWTLKICLAPGICIEDFSSRTLGLQMKI